MDFKDLYKKSVDVGAQQRQRQLQILKEQKLRRLHEQDVCRDLPVLSEPNQIQCTSKTKFKKCLQHQYKLQESEWLRHRPENLGDWLLVPCPRGKRCLVIASRGRTKVYNKAGRHIMQMRTMLPGDSYALKSRTILDCIYIQEQDCFYVLDALNFGHHLLECETTFRFYWIKSRFGEQEELMQRTKRNEKPFYLLESYDFENAPDLEMALQRYPYWPENKPQLDGLLFYHKEASYTCGTTPLVCWLFPFMLPDVLNLPVHASYESPGDYMVSSPLAYMEHFDKKLLAQRSLQKKRKTGSTTAQTGMDVEVTTEEHEDEYGSLKRLLERERCLELEELTDMESAANL